MINLEELCAVGHAAEVFSQRVLHESSKSKTSVKFEEVVKSETESANEITQLYLILCDSTDCSPPDFSVRGAFQARVLEWVAISFSRGSPHPGMEPRSPAVQADASPSEPPGRPLKRLDPECQHSE